jgi:SAM-dependent methyltransferase
MRAPPRLDYDTIADRYNTRFDAKPLSGAADWLRALPPSGAGRVLEVGCGTGHWLAGLAPGRPHLFGLDLSAGMLRQARAQGVPAGLVRGEAGDLPWPDGTFDVVYCINALHHFPQPARFVAEARRLLRPGGALATAGMNPHTGRDRWYVYDYFPGTRATDLARFLSPGALLDLLAAAGFVRAEWRVIERIDRVWVGREVLADPFLPKHSTSQLALLGDDAYAAGRQRLEADLAAAEARGETLRFPNQLTLGGVVGWLPAADDRQPAPG